VSRKIGDCMYEYRLSASDWETIFTQSPIGLALMANDKSWTQINKRLCSILEYTISELLEKTFQEVTHPADLDADLIMLEKVTSGEIDGYEMIKRYITKTNNIVWVRQTVASVKNEEGAIMNYVTHIQPLLNGERAKLEKIGNNQIHVRPTIKVGEFIADNYQWFISLAIGMIIFSVSLGVAAWGAIDKMNRMEKDQQKIEQILDKAKN